MKSKLRYSTTGDVYVMVDNEERHVGKLVSGTLLVERNPEKQIMKKWNAYGVNCELIDSGNVQTVFIDQLNSKSLMISAEDVKTVARIHKEEGWDEQYFIPIESFIEV